MGMMSMPTLLIPRSGLLAPHSCDTRGGLEAAAHDAAHGQLHGPRRWGQHRSVGTHAPSD